MSSKLDHMTELFYRHDFDRNERFVFIFIDDTDFNFLMKHGTRTIVCKPIDQIHDFKEITVIRLREGYLDGSMYLCRILESYYVPVEDGPLNGVDLGYIHLTIKLIETIAPDTFSHENCERRAVEFGTEYSGDDHE